MLQHDPRFWEAIAAYLAAALASVSLWAWKHTHGLIKSKAEATTVESVLIRLEHALADQRLDNQRIFDRIDDVVTSHSNFAQQCVQELGKRPTREECQTLWHKK